MPKDTLDTAYACAKENLQVFLCEEPDILKKNYGDFGLALYWLLKIAVIEAELDDPAETEKHLEKCKLSLDDYPSIKHDEQLYDCASLLFTFLTPYKIMPSQIKQFDTSTLFLLSEIISAIPYDDKNILYQRFAQNLFKLNINAIKKKEKIKVAFFLPSVTYFSCEVVYRQFEKDPRYDPYLVLICHYQDTKMKSKKDSIKFFNDMCDYFKDTDFKYIVAYDPDTDESLGYEQIGAPDLIFHPYPYTERYFGEKLSVTNLPLSALNIYVPYGIHIVNKPERQFDRTLHRVAFKLYYETALHKELAAEHSMMGTSNVVISGYVKMDDSYKISQGRDMSLWKNAGKPLRRIIYAPHHSLPDNKPSLSGTFHFNSEFIYALAKATPSISWVIKPHPDLRVRSVTHGFYKSVEEYDAYMQRWADLPNGSVLQEGLYTDLFATSDAMIFDSLSFMSEYLYYHKPSLFLTKPKNDFNRYGKLLLSVLYTADGKDFNAIKNFVTEVVIKGNDWNKENREKFFSEYLDYKTINGKLAAEMIYDDINSYFTEVKA